MNNRKHIVITGTGRTGTTFLVELLTNLGLDTGYNPEQLKEKKNKNSRAGLENDLRKDNCPYIAKDPWFCDYAQEVLSRSDIEIEHVFIPMRDLKAAVASRKHVTEMGTKNAKLEKKIGYLFGKKKKFAGGIHTKAQKNNNQEEILLQQVYNLILALSNTDVNITLIKYPRSTKDANYLYHKLKPILKDITFSEFSTVYNKTVNPDLVNSFTKNDN